jgi:hypothetical protein
MKADTSNILIGKFPGTLPMHNSQLLFASQVQPLGEREEHTKRRGRLN